MRYGAPAIAVALLLAFCGGSSAQLFIRGVEVADSRPVQRITREGVVVGDSASVLVPWFRVKAVAGELADEARPYRSIAERSWRARERLARRDIPLATRLFRPLFDEYDTGEGQTSAMIAQGLLSCELDAGEHLRALPPFIATLRTRDASDIDPAAIRTDTSTGLAPDLPPFWTPPFAKRAASLLGEARPAEADASPTQYAIATMYLLSAIDPPPAAPGERLLIEHDPSDPASALLNDLLAARIGSPEQRRDARAALLARIDKDAGTWIEAWCRIGVARSLLQEPNESDRRRAVIELLYVPSRFEASPRLTMLSLAFACDALIDLGDTDQARRINALLESRTPPAEISAWIRSRFQSASSPTTTDKEPE